MTPALRLIKSTNMLNGDKQPLRVLITDIQLHSTENNNPNTFKRRLEKSIKSGKDGRFYDTKMQINENGKLEFVIDLPEELSNQIEFLSSSDGVPICLGKDVVEKIQSLIKKK